MWIDENCQNLDWAAGELGRCQANTSSASWDPAAAAVTFSISLSLAAATADAAAAAGEKGGT